MSTTVHVPENLGEKLSAEATRRGVSVDELSTELIASGLGPSENSDIKPRRLAFAAVGASGASRGADDADDLLAKGFGRD